jgi:hypothetical protein
MTFTEIDPGAWLKGLWRVAPSFVTAASLTGCATSPRPDAAQASLSNPVAAQWHAPLPHGGTLADLSRWWASFDDAPLLHLIQAAQQASDTLARAGARIADARAARVESRAALLPALDAGLNANRGAPSLALPVSTTASLGVQASWEADLFGANRARAEMAQARWRASEGAWHVARVSLAAEVAARTSGCAPVRLSGRKRSWMSGRGPRPPGSPRCRRKPASRLRPLPTSPAPVLPTPGRR